MRNKNPGKRAGPLVPAGSRLIMGRNTVRQTLRHDPARFIAVYLSAAEKSAGSRAELKAELARHPSIKTAELTAAQLNDLAQSDTHQGVVAVLKSTAAPTLKELIKYSHGDGGALFLLLDGIADPQNLGALLRAAECFAADGVLITANQSASVTPVAAKASVGASELLPIVQVSNLANALRPIKEAGIWIVAADGSADSEPLESFEFPQKCALLMGAEGRGLQPLLKKEADFRVKIPLLGAIESLNVSQACAIMLYQYRQQHGKIVS